MKIAQVVCHFPPDWGGIASAVIGYSRALSELGHDVTVITPRYSEYPQGEDEQFPFCVLWLRPLVSSGRAAVLPQLLWRLGDYDVVHLHYPFYGSAELVALFKILHPSTRLKLHYHMDAKASGLKGFYFRAYARVVLPTLLHLSDVITCSTLDYVQTSDAAGYLAAHPEKYSQVPYGVDQQLFRPAPDAHHGDSKTVLFVGSMTKPGYFKGLANLMRAFQSVATIVEKSRLVVVGHGEMEDYYRRLAVDLGIADKVEFVTEADDAALVRCYQACDVLVLPPFNRNESFGIVLLEAMACAKPVIASDLPGVRVVFENGKQGLLVRPGHIDDLVEKILDVLQDDESARRLGEAGRELVEREYSWQLAARRLTKLYECPERAPAEPTEAQKVEAGSRNLPFDPRKVRVLEVAPCAGTEVGGAEVVIDAMFTSLEESGLDVHMLTCRKNPRYSYMGAFTNAIPVKAFVSGSRVIDWLMAWRILAHIRHNPRPDIVHAQDTYCLPAVVIAAGRLGVPCVATVHNSFLIPWRDMRPLLRPWGWFQFERRAKRLRRFINRVDCAVFVSKDLAEDWISNGAKPVRSKVIYNPEPGWEMNAPQPTDSGIALLAVGRLDFNKGYQTLLHAIGLLDDSLDVRLTIAGDGIYRPKLVRLAGELGILNRVRFVGWVAHEELKDLYQDSHVVVLPSLCREALGLVALEAMSVGRPVIASRIGGLSEVVLDGTTGFLVEPGEARDLARSIELLARDPSLRQSMGEQGAIFVRQQFSRENATRECIEVYAEALNRR